MAAPRNIAAAYNAKRKKAKKSIVPAETPKMVDSSVIKSHDIDARGNIVEGYAEGDQVKKPNPSEMTFENLKTGIMDMIKHKKPERPPIKDFGPIKREYAGGGAISYTNKPDKGYGAIIFKADGGEIEDKQHGSIAEAIRAKKAYMENGRYEHPEDAMLKEGEVDIDDNGKEMPNAYYHQNEEEVLEANLDADMEGMEQPSDSNEHTDNIDSDQHDMISKIRSKMRVKNVFR